MNIVGIDLGTTFSGLAVLDEIGKPQIVPNADSGRITPSIVFFDPDKDGATIVGEEARKQMVLHPDRVIVEVKQQMGTDTIFTVGDLSLTPTEISSLILKKILQDAEKTKGNIDEAVITVPANFLEAARRATKDAGEMAGLKKVTLVDEPVAAAMLYATTQSVHGRVLVYDLGGGTFDVTIADVDGTDVEVVASQGDPHLGGKDFDRKLAGLLNDQYKEKCGQTLFDESPDHQLMNKAEEIKKTLSKKENAKDVIMGPDGPQSLEVTRAQFEEAISTYIGKAESLIDVALSEAGSDESGIDHVLLVGGSTRVDCIPKRLEKRFGREPTGKVNVDEAVALGAAIHGGLNADPDKMNSVQQEAMKEINLTDVAPAHYGTLALRRSISGEPEMFNSIIIRKNTPIPCSKTEGYTTVADGQASIDCSVTQCTADEDNPDFVTKISETTLDGLPPGRPAGQEIEVTFSYDNNKMMQCKFKDVESGENTTLEIRPDDYKARGNMDSNLSDFLVE